MTDDNDYYVARLARFQTQRKRAQAAIAEHMRRMGADAAISGYRFTNTERLSFESEWPTYEALLFQFAHIGDRDSFQTEYQTAMRTLSHLWHSLMRSYIDAGVPMPADMVRFKRKTPFRRTVTPATRAGHARRRLPSSGAPPAQRVERFLLQSPLLSHNESVRLSGLAGDAAPAVECSNRSSPAVSNRSNRSQSAAGHGPPAAAASLASMQSATPSVGNMQCGACGSTNIVAIAAAADGRTLECNAWRAFFAQVAEHVGEANRRIGGASCADTMQRFEGWRTQAERNIERTMGTSVPLPLVGAAVFAQLAALERRAGELLCDGGPSGANIKVLTLSLPQSVTPEMVAQAAA